jgi:hypothetical protein
VLRSALSCEHLITDWVKNVLAAGGCELKTRGKKYQLSAPKIVRDPTRRQFPIPVRVGLSIVGADEYMELPIPAVFAMHTHPTSAPPHQSKSPEPKNSHAMRLFDNSGKQNPLPTSATQRYQG